MNLSAGHRALFHDTCVSVMLPLFVSLMRTHCARKKAASPTNGRSKLSIMRSDHFPFLPLFFPLSISIFVSFALSSCHLLSHPPLSFPFLSPTHRHTYSFHILNPGGAANEFHALLTLTKPSEHFWCILRANGFLNEEQEDLNSILVRWLSSRLLVFV